MKALRAAWKQRVRQTRADDPTGVLAWHERVVVPYAAGPGNPDICAILDRDGNTLQTIATPTPHTRRRTPSGPVITWPDEALVAGVLEEDQFYALWLDPDAASHAVPTEIVQRHTFMQISLAASSSAEVFAGVVSNPATFDDVLGWPLDEALDRLYTPLRRAAFPDHEVETHIIGRGGVVWRGPGHVACVADEVAICEQGSGSERCITARRSADGTELWRRAAVDGFVLGAIPMPAWSDERVYVVERGARRAEAWAREQESVLAHGITANAWAHTILAIRAQRARRGDDITTPSVLQCWSTRTGKPLWEAPVAGDVVSFYCHAAWVAVVIARLGEGTLRISRHDGQVLSEAPIQPMAQTPFDLWPPDASRWPAVVHGDDERIVVVQNRGKHEGGGRFYEASIASPHVPIWEVPLAVNAVSAPANRYFRLVNRASIALTRDAAFVRSGKQLYGFVS